MNMLEKCVELIEGQQKGIEGTAPWVVGEQLKELLQAEPELAGTVLKDLEWPGMGLADCEKKIKEEADRVRRGNFAYVSPARAEEIIRAFYGLPERGEKTAAPRKAAGGKILDLADFL